MKLKFTIDDLLIVCFLVLTIWHSSHILAHFEIIGELAWPLSVGVDVGIARAAWVASSRGANRGAKNIGIAWLAFLLGASYGLNVAYYAERKADIASWALASLFPVSLACAGALKAFLARGETGVKQLEVIAPAPFTPPAADSGGGEIEPLEIARGMKQQGATLDEIAQVVGKSRRTVQLWLNKK